VSEFSRQNFCPFCRGTPFSAKTRDWRQTTGENAPLANENCQLANGNNSLLLADWEIKIDKKQTEINEKHVLKGNFGATIRDGKAIKGKCRATKWNCLEAKGNWRSSVNN
jgi:hypothetical protein